MKAETKLKKEKKQPHSLFTGTKNQLVDKHAPLKGILRDGNVSRDVTYLRKDFLMSFQPLLSPTKAAHRCSVSCRQMRVRTVFLQNPVRVTETELRHCDTGLFVSNDLTKKNCMFSSLMTTSPSPSGEKTCQPACCTPVARSRAFWWLRRVADEPFLMSRLLVNLFILH